MITHRRYRPLRKTDGPDATTGHPLHGRSIAEQFLKLNLYTSTSIIFMFSKSQKGAPGTDSIQQEKYQQNIESLTVSPYWAINIRLSKVPLFP